MSSPTVLTFVPMPAHEARAANLRLAQTYLTLGQAVWDRAYPKAAALRLKGIGVPDPTVFIDAARAKAEQLLAGSDSSEGLRYAHAVYQNLKHPWADLVDKMTVESAAEAEIAQLLAGLEERRRVAAVVQQLTLVCGLPSIQMLTSAPGSSVDEMISARLTTIVEIALAADPRRNVDALRGEIEAVLASVRHAEQKLAVLDGLRVRMEDELSARKRLMAFERLQAEQAEVAREALRIRTNALYEELGPLSEADDTRLRAEVDRIAAAIGSHPEIELDRQTDAVHDEILKARARKSVYDLVIKTLRRQGYDEIEEGPSLALGPEAIRRRYFRRPGDAERLVEFASNESDLLSVETVRLTAANVETKQADREAQQQLCSVMKRAVAGMDESWRSVVVHEGAVGAVMAVRTDLEMVARKQSGRAHVAAQERATR